MYPTKPEHSSLNYEPATHYDILRYIAVTFYVFQTPISRYFSIAGMF